jgi:hypothetical protein
VELVDLFSYYKHPRDPIFLQNNLIWGDFPACYAGPAMQVYEIVPSIL